MLVLLDWTFFVLHTFLIAFNMIGWAWKRTRLAHLVVLSLTCFSWFVMGAYRGWGYCLCTDWHFQIRRKLGYAVAESSFIQLLLDKTIGLRISLQSSDVLAVSVLIAILIATAITWGIVWRRGTKKSEDRRLG